MTGYGKSLVVYKGKKINIEIKSLNSKQLDLMTRIAPLYREKEMEIRQLIAEKLLRGKVDFSIWIEKDESTLATPVNTALMQNYFDQLKGFAQRSVGRRRVGGSTSGCVRGYTALGRLPCSGGGCIGEEICRED